jgi:hypothetical protein
MFINELEQYYITPAKYLKTAKLYAKMNGYDPKLLSFSLNPKYKLSYQHNDKSINFGSPTNKDYLIYQNLEDKKMIEKGQADKHRQRYLSRAMNIKGEWKDNKYSKNNLAIKVLWKG